jgi:hypothetical protein
VAVEVPNGVDPFGWPLKSLSVGHLRSLVVESAWIVVSELRTHFSQAKQATTQPKAKDLRPLRLIHKSCR